MSTGIRAYECRHLMCYAEKGRKKVLVGVGSGLRDGLFSWADEKHLGQDLLL